MGDERTTPRSRRYRVTVVVGLMILGLGGLAHAQDEAHAPTGRGFVWGGAIAAGRLSFPGSGAVGLAVGEVTSGVTIAGEAMDVRAGELVHGTPSSAAGAPGVISFPEAQASAGFSFHAGYAFSHRLALLLQAELVAGVESGFSSAMGGVVLRFWPTSRLWVEAGPASGDLSYGYEGTVVEGFTGTGYGVHTGAGVTVLRKPRWDLGLQVRYGTLSFEGFRATSLSFGLAAGSRPR